MPRTDSPSGWDERTILAGLVNHLRWVEYYWFQVMLLGEEDHGPGPRGIPTGRCASPWRSHHPAAS
jgi:Protein of unknown function (DUF664)